MTDKFKKTILIDLDGVLNTYNGNTIKIISHLSKTEHISIVTLYYIPENTSKGANGKLLPNKSIF